VWDEKPKEAELRIVFEPVEQTIDGRRFTGFKYWFEYASRDVAIHRLLDRQTWEVGGDLTDVNVVCRGIFDVPRKKVTRAGGFSTVRVGQLVGIIAGQTSGAAGRCLPGFDMQYGRSGVLLAWFDQVSLIRTVIESTPGEDWVRHLDFHYFQEARRVRTNPKTVVWCPDRLDHTDALNLWTRLQDAEQAKACRQFRIRHEEPPAIVFSENVWFNFKFDSTYNKHAGGRGGIRGRTSSSLILLGEHGDLCSDLTPDGGGRWSQRIVCWRSSSAPTCAARSTSRYPNPRAARRD